MTGRPPEYLKLSPFSTWGWQYQSITITGLFTGEKNILKCINIELPIFCPTGRNAGKLCFTTDILRQIVPVLVFVILFFSKKIPPWMRWCHTDVFTVYLANHIKKRSNLLKSIEDTALYQVSSRLAGYQIFNKTQQKKNNLIDFLFALRLCDNVSEW